jgi:hypothetical protein
LRRQARRGRLPNRQRHRPPQQQPLLPLPAQSASTPRTFPSSCRIVSDDSTVTQVPDRSADDSAPTSSSARVARSGRESGDGPSSNSRSGDIAACSRTVGAAAPARRVTGTATPSYIRVMPLLRNAVSSWPQMTTRARCDPCEPLNCFPLPVPAGCVAASPSSVSDARRQLRDLHNGHPPLLPATAAPQRPPPRTRTAPTRLCPQRLGRSWTRPARLPQTQHRPVRRGRRPLLIQTRRLHRSTGPPAGCVARGRCSRSAPPAR